MRLIIAGSRSLGRLDRYHWDYEWLVAQVDRIIQAHGLEPTEVVSGGAGGPDRAGELWAQVQGLPVRQFLPDWNGPRGRGAGLARNSDMQAYADGLVALYDGKSKGTLDMIGKMEKAGKLVHCEVCLWPSSS